MWSRETLMAINIGLVVVNLFITIILNYILFYRRRKNDRNYQTEYNYYSKLVIDKISDIIEASKEIDIIIKDTISECQKIIENDESGDNGIRKCLQKKTDEIENKQEEFERDTLPILKCYSVDLYNAIKRPSDDFFSNSSSICTKILEKSAQNHWEDNILNMYTELKNSCLDKMFELIKKHKPDLK